MKVALFDIDGTLIWTHGAGRRAMERALHAVFGAGGPGGQHYAGKTDPQIVREAMRHAGFDDRTIDARMPDVLAHYLGCLDEELVRPGPPPHALPGVAEALDALEARDDVLLALLTGNVADGATRKLRAVGVNPARFPVGAFGSDHEERPELAVIARTRASSHLRREITGGACVVIGDTPADVHCSRAIGARCVAVATGGFDVAALEACGAEVVLPDLRDTAAVVQAIVGG